MNEASGTTGVPSPRFRLQASSPDTACVRRLAERNTIFSHVAPGDGDIVGITIVVVSEDFVAAAAPPSPPPRAVCVVAAAPLYALPPPPSQCSLSSTLPPPRLVACHRHAPPLLSGGVWFSQSKFLLVNDENRDICVNCYNQIFH
jgi:hypothetical protein